MNKNILILFLLFIFSGCANLNMNTSEFENDLKSYDSESKNFHFIVMDRKGFYIIKLYEIPPTQSFGNLVKSWEINRDQFSPNLIHHMETLQKEPLNIQRK